MLSLEGVEQKTWFRQELGQACLTGKPSPEELILELSGEKRLGIKERKRVESITDRSNDVPSRMSQDLEIRESRVFPKPCKKLMLQEGREHGEVVQNDKGKAHKGLANNAKDGYR